MNRKLFLILTLIFLVFSISILAQKSKKKTTPKTKLISVGVLNGKAKNLVVPKFPKTALAIGIHGTVEVSVIINEEGKVIKAEVISGHGLLKVNSVKAALESTFIPLILSGKPIKVIGIIIYNYIPNYYNWLEIGYSIKDANILGKIPKGFENEKAFFKIYRNANYKDKQVAFDNFVNSIEGKLSEDDKTIWLFRVGMFLEEIQEYRYSTKENTEQISSKLDNLLLNTPENVSQNFTAKLKTISKLLRYPELNTDNPLKESKLNEKLTEIEVLMPMFGR